MSPLLRRLSPLLRRFSQKKPLTNSNHSGSAGDMEMISPQKQPFFYTYQQYFQKAKNTKRGSNQYNTWRSKVLRRYDYQCAKCHTRENLHVHHIRQYIDNIFLRTRVSNGIVLCRDCHSTEHPWLPQTAKKKYILRKKANLSGGEILKRADTNIPAHQSSRQER